jgi:regulator of sirC expression with transglutaminase-like and TPR domain
MGASMIPWVHVSPEFSRLLAGDPRVDLARIALEIARDQDPEVDVERALDQIGALARRIQDRCPQGGDATTILKQIQWALFIEDGFHGNRDEYYDPRNSDLNQVIARKTGIPITLCILYRAVAKRLGLELPGVNLPAHFMLKHEGPRGALFIDPFHGDLLDRNGCEQRLSRIVQQPVVLNDDQIAACPPRLIVARMLRNLKVIQLQQGDLAAVLTVQRRLAAILDELPEEQRDLGLLCLQLGRLEEAVEALERFLTARPDHEDASRILGLLRGARREIALRN